METITDTARFADVATALAWAKANDWSVFTRGAKKAVASRIVGTGKKAVVETMFLGGAEGDRYWAIMRAA